LGNFMDKENILNKKKKYKDGRINGDEHGKQA
jgi:hypothetical protein